MLKFLKILLITISTVLLSAIAFVYFIFYSSLPELDGDSQVDGINNTIVLQRDALGQAVISTKNRQDAAYALGFAHAQDRLFQMDAQRRAAAGTLSALLGKSTLKLDKQVRFHDFASKASLAYAQLPQWQRELLTQYTKGVNDAVEESLTLPMEYQLTRNHFTPWAPEDSLLVIYSMYLDLQLGQVKRDLAFTRVAHHFGDEMVEFLLQPSQYQAALDGSERTSISTIPTLPKQVARRPIELNEPFDIGSNNWAVSGALTDSSSAMLANDMHLSLRVPIIWYRAQLNYTLNNLPVSVTGVSLPGVPGIVVGTNGHIAWGFTNAYLDNTDWITLDSDTPVRERDVSIEIAKSEPHTYKQLESDYGPVRIINGKAYALKWVAHQDYAANIGVVQLDSATSVTDAIPLAKSFGMPVQNLTLVDKTGNLAWTPAGAVTGRKQPSNTAIEQEQYDSLWDKNEDTLPVVYNPSHQRIWTANARVISADDFARFGDGGYAVGARGKQIKSRLFEREMFDESSFYRIQLDNEARFLIPWHALLYRTLATDKASNQIALTHLDNWQTCACEDSVGYTLVRRFRSEVIAQLFAPIFTVLQSEDVSHRHIIRHLEPATWDILNQQPSSWLPSEHTDWQAFLAAAHEQSVAKMKEKHGADESLNALTWGKVNQLTVKHPLGDIIPLFGKSLHMQTTAGFGDSFMPAVQGTRFGASQRLFVRPGDLDKAILTLPGGQSGHPLSPFYRAGFVDYIQQQSTPLLPQTILHTRRFEPVD